MSFASPPFEPLTASQAQAYVNRLSTPNEPNAPDLSTLNALVTARVERIPFENLDPLLKRQVDIDADVVFSKVVERGRGGICFELNSLFSRLLLALGYRLKLRVARVRTAVLTTAPPLATMEQHVLLFELLQEGTFLVDVAFVVQIPHAVSTANCTGGADFAQLRPLSESGILELSVPHSCVGRLVLYHVEPRPIAWIDCAPLCWYLTRNPKSMFRNKLMVARWEGDVCMNLNNCRYTRTTKGSELYVHQFQNVRRLLDLLKDDFSI